MNNNLPDELVINGAVYIRQKIREEARSEPARSNGVAMCDCNKPAKSYTGVAKTGPKAGEKFVKYFCAENRCDFKKFEDA